jgi:hypothetical protein
MSDIIIIIVAIMKVLVLFIYSENALYNEMLNLQRKYVNTHSDITSYFVQFRKDQTNAVEIVNDIIYVKGEEDRMNITTKTLLAMQYVLCQMNLTFDYVVRSNVSTVINFGQLIQFCSTIPKENIYTSGQVLNLQWLDHSSGIFNDELFGTLYASGTSILWSYDVAIHLANNIDKIRTDIIDDVTFGVYLKQYLPNTIHSLQKYPIPYASTSELISIDNILNSVVIRNRIQNSDSQRNLDLIYMDFQINKIYSNT